MYIFPEDGHSMLLRTGGIQVPDCTHDHTTNSHPSESRSRPFYLFVYRSLNNFVGLLSRYGRCVFKRKVSDLAGNRTAMSYLPQPSQFSVLAEISFWSVFKSAG